MCTGACASLTFKCPEFCVNENPTESWGHNSSVPSNRPSKSIADCVCSRCQFLIDMMHFYWLFERPGNPTSAGCSRFRGMSKQTVPLLSSRHGTSIHCTVDVRDPSPSLPTRHLQPVRCLGPPQDPKGPALLTQQNERDSRVT